MDTIHQGTRDEVLFALDHAIQIVFESGKLSNIRPVEFTRTGGNCAAYETNFTLDGMNQSVQVMITGADVLYYGDGSLADFGSCVTLCMYADDEMCEPIIGWDLPEVELCQRDITDLQSLKTAVVGIIRDHIRFVNEVK